MPAAKTSKKTNVAASTNNNNNAVKSVVAAATSGTVGTRNYISEALAKEVLIKMQQDVPQDNYPSAKDVQSVLETFVNLIVQRTIRGENTTITNFATFSRQFTPARIHKNPRDGSEVPKDAHYKVKVEIKPALKEKLEEVQLTPEDKTKAAASNSK